MTFEAHYGDEPPDVPENYTARRRWKDRKTVWIKAQAEEREIWREWIDKEAEQHTGAVQAALWGVAERLEKNVRHVSVGPNSGGQ